MTADLIAIAAGYCEAAEFTQDEEPGRLELSAESKVTAVHHVNDFVARCAAAGIDWRSTLQPAGFRDHDEDGVQVWREAYTERDLGHDIWFSRNGHGTGFFDRDHAIGDKAMRDALQGIARAMGEAYAYHNPDTGELEFD